MKTPLSSAVLQTPNPSLSKRGFPAASPGFSPFHISPETGQVELPVLPTHRDLTEF
jgi:hypothetical protein